MFMASFRTWSSRTTKAERFSAVVRPASNSCFMKASISASARRPRYGSRVSPSRGLTFETPYTTRATAGLSVPDKTECVRRATSSAEVSVSGSRGGASFDRIRNATDACSKFAIGCANFARE